MKLSLMNSISSLITEYHRMYAEFKNPEHLKIAAELGKVTGPDFQELWEAKVNAGCIRDRIPLLYPQAKEPITNKPMGE